MKILESPSSRRAWVEMNFHHVGFGVVQSPSSRRAWVEMITSSTVSGKRGVALLAEGVGRNVHGAGLGRRLRPSPSSRRAWVEMPVVSLKTSFVPVALLAEGVGRNKGIAVGCKKLYVALLAEGVGRNRRLAFLRFLRIKSPSSRRAWVEIRRLLLPPPSARRRPPRGGRG